MAIQKHHVIHLKRHHKFVIGGITAIVIISLIVIGILINAILTKQNLNYNSLNNKIDELKSDTQAKLNELTESVLQAQEELNSLGSQVGSIDKEFDLLKASTSADFSGIIEDAIKGVVTVRTDVGQGTGFIITNDGYVVTNAHVLSGGRTINVVTYEHGSTGATFIGYDTELDIALIKISGNYDKLKLGDSDSVQIGEKVIAIGNPLGLQFSVTEGIISGIHRPGPTGLEAYIQTDAALNPGNSGGPLINKQGRVIGINNFKVGGGESLGFALESNYIETSVNNISLQILNQTLI
ncbi:MAG TPA: trypsin-like serine protease [Candidatus Pacearchaeota archaeon]|nr:putative serine protease HtrA [archaeon BMS3Abin17]HDK41792.1 trypsin-like serine protease [Candidatus Pacearchaeota archaeon]HDZ60628.1 trypsin-like serine protease [Candidatus Pacearchaeota archaeon]